MLGDVVREQRELNRLASNDPYIINSLRRCGIDSPIIFSLIWGEKMAYSKMFPPALEKIVLDMIQEEEKKNESYDSTEEKLHQIIIDLSQVMYETYVTELVKLANAGI